MATPAIDLDARDSVSRKQNKVSLLAEIAFRYRKTENQTNVIMCQAMMRTREQAKKEQGAERDGTAAWPAGRVGRQGRGCCWPLEAQAPRQQEQRPWGQLRGSKIARGESVTERTGRKRT